MSKKFKITVPVDPLNPADNCVQCGINGNFTTIMRGHEVVVSEEIYKLLKEGRYSPSVEEVIDEDSEAKKQAEEAKLKKEAEAKKKAEAEALSKAQAGQ